MIQKKYPLADSTMIILYILVVYLISWIFVTYIPNRTLTDLSIFLPGIVALLFMWWQNLEIKSLFRWGDTKNVFIGFVAPLMIMLFSMAVCSIFSFAHYSFPAWVLNWYQESLLAGLIEILFIILFTPLVLGCVFSLGEEIGWRGYLLKQLKDVVPHFLVRALSVGIIWGAWHVPTYYHLGFSMPQLGIFLINVCLISVFYTYLFEKQNSIWPTVIAHTYHTTFINYVLPFVTSSEENIPLLFGDAGLLVTAGYAVIALIIYIQKMRDQYMQRNTLLTNLEQFKKKPHFTPEEQSKYPQFIDFVMKNPHCFERHNPGHVTGSAWIVNSALTHALLTHHKKLNIWLQLGGHADGDPDIQAVALKEAQEESGIEELKLLMNSIYDIDIHPIPGKCLFHYDVRYLIVAPDNATYLVSDESHDLAWVPLDQIGLYSQERSVLRMTEKMGSIKNQFKSNINKL